MRISVQVKELLPVIEKYIKETYGIKEEIELIYTSKTTFLTFMSKD